MTEPEKHNPWWPKIRGDDMDLTEFVDWDKPRIGDTVRIQLPPRFRCPPAGFRRREIVLFKDVDVSIIYQIESLNPIKGKAVQIQRGYRILTDRGPSYFSHKRRIK